MRTLLLACFALALLTFCSCEKDELNAVKSDVPAASTRSSGELSLIVAYGDRQIDTIAVDSFIAVVYGFSLMSVQAWANGSSAGSYLATSVVANHSSSDLDLQTNPGRGGNSYTGKSSAQLLMSQGVISATIQGGNITTTCTSIVGEETEGI